MSDTPVYLKAEAVAVKLGWHVQTVYRNRELPRVKIGGSVRWIESQIDAYLAMRSVVTAQPVTRHQLKAVESKQKKFKAV